MKGLDHAFDRALGLRAPAPLTQHTILLLRAQAVHDGAADRVALCDIALGRTPDMAALSREDTSRFGWLTKRDAGLELARATTRLAVRP